MPAQQKAFSEQKQNLRDIGDNTDTDTDTDTAVMLDGLRSCRTT